MNAQRDFFVINLNLCKIAYFSSDLSIFVPVKVLMESNQYCDSTTQLHHDGTVCVSYIILLLLSVVLVTEY